MPPPDSLVDQATPSKLTLNIEVEGPYSRSSTSYDYVEAMESIGNQSIARLEVTIHETGSAEEDGPPQNILHHSLIEDPDEGIKPNKPPLPRPSNGTYITTHWSSLMTKEVAFPEPPPYLLSIFPEGVKIGGVLFSWMEIEDHANWPHEDDIRTFVDGKESDLPADETLEAIARSDDFQVRTLAPSLLAELNYLIAHGHPLMGISNPDQFIREAGTRPEVLLEFALTMPWESARCLVGPPELTWWLENNHPQSPGEKSRPSRPCHH